MKLVAEVLTGSLFYVEVEDDATVGDLKKKIGEQENLPTARLILMLDTDERPLLNRNDVRLKDYGVQDSSHIYIFFKPLGHDPRSSPSTPKASASSASTPCKRDQNEPSDEDDERTSSESDQNEPSEEDDERTPSESDQNEPSNEEDDMSTTSADLSSDQQED